jgi:hypothetical protein
MNVNPEIYPFAQELIADTEGQIRKVVINLADYQQILAILEDEGLHRAMVEVQGETPLTRAEALEELEKE